MSGTFIRVAAATIVATTTAGAALAADTLWSYEGFDYTLGSALNGADGGSGWAGAWSEGNGVMGIVGGLSYTDADGRRLAVSGGAADAYGSYGTAQRFTQQDWGAPDTSVWISVLQANAPVVANAAGATVTLAYGPENYGAMYAGIGKTASGSLRSVVGLTNTSIKASGSGSLAPRETVLHVVRYDFAADGADTISLWRNPLLGQVLDAPAVSASFSDMASVLTGLTLGFTTDGADHRFIFDELRIGSSFAAVTPITSAVPEPASASMLAAGLAAMLATLRRRSRREAA